MLLVCIHHSISTNSHNSWISIWLSVTSKLKLIMTSSNSSSSLYNSLPYISKIIKFSLRWLSFEINYNFIIILYGRPSKDLIKVFLLRKLVLIVKKLLKFKRIASIDGIYLILLMKSSSSHTSYWNVILVSASWRLRNVLDINFVVFHFHFRLGWTSHNDVSMGTFRLVVFLGSHLTSQNLLVSRY